MGYTDTQMETEKWKMKEAQVRVDTRTAIKRELCLPALTLGTSRW